jgi:hypothetical protein
MFLVGVAANRSRPGRPHISASEAARAPEHLASSIGGQARSPREPCFRQIGGQVQKGARNLDATAPCHRTCPPVAAKSAQPIEPVPLSLSVRRAVAVAPKVRRRTPTPAGSHGSRFLNAPGFSRRRGRSAPRMDAANLNRTRQANPRAENAGHGRPIIRTRIDRLLPRHRDRWHKTPDRRR